MHTVGVRRAVGHFLQEDEERIVHQQVEAHTSLQLTARVRDQVPAEPAMHSAHQILTEQGRSVDPILLCFALHECLL